MFVKILALAAALLASPAFAEPPAPPDTAPAGDAIGRTAPAPAPALTAPKSAEAVINTDPEITLKASEWQAILAKVQADTVAGPAIAKFQVQLPKPPR